MSAIGIGSLLGTVGFDKVVTPRPGDRVTADTLAAFRKLYASTNTFTIRPGTPIMGAPDPAEVPTQITLLTPDPADPGSHQLLIDGHPVAPDNWSLEDTGHATSVLTWQQTAGAAPSTGTLTFAIAGFAGSGAIETATGTTAVSTDRAPVTYTCDLSTTQAAYVVDNGGVAQLLWTTDSEDWLNADWQRRALEFTFALTNVTDGMNGTSTQAIVSIAVPGSDPWQPDPYDVQLDISTDYRLSFAYVGLDAPPDGMPYQLDVALDTDQTGTSLTGAMLIGVNSAAGQVKALRGVVRAPEVVRPQARLATATAESPGGPPFTTLNNMSTFKPVGKTWQDFAQTAAMNNLWELVKYYMPEDLRKTFINTNQEKLSDEAEAVRTMTVPGVDQDAVAQWYADLAVPYLTASFAGSTSRGADQLNGRRAATYLRRAVAKSKVYQTHGPALYAKQYLKLQPELNDYLYDQATTNEIRRQEQRDRITSVWNVWLEAVPVGPRYDDATKHIAELVAAGMNGKYWAFYLYRKVTESTALGELSRLSTSSSQGVDGSAYVQRVQEITAKLNLLDPSGLFAREFLDDLTRHQLLRVIPRLIDYTQAGEFTPIIGELLEAFVKQAAGNSDLVDFVTEAQKLIDQQETEYALGILSGIAGGASATIGYEKLSQVLDDQFPAGTNGRYGVRTAQLLQAVIGGASLAMMIRGYADWEDLDTLERAELCTNTAIWAVNVTTGVVKRGATATVAMIYDDGPLEMLRVLWTGDLPNATVEAQRTVLRWLLRSGKSPGGTGTGAGNQAVQAATRDVAAVEMTDMSTTAEAGADVARAAATPARTFTDKMIGSSLSEFSAGPLATVFAAISLGFSAEALAHAETVEEKVLDSIMVTSASLELVAGLGNWAVMVGVVESGTLIAGTVAVSSVLACVSGAAIVAAVAGVVALAVVMELHHEETPLEQFRDDQATKAGLAMPDGFAIEYLTPFQNDKQLSRCALAVDCWTGSRNVSLVIGADGTLSTIDSSTQDPAKAVVLRTDEFGRVSIVRLIRGEKSTALYLTRTADGKLAGAPALSGDDAARQLWVPTPGSGSPLKEEDYFASAPFTLSPAGQETTYLSTDDAGNLQLSSDARVWSISAISLPPAALDMETVKLSSSYRTGRAFTPVFAGPVSEPLTWSVAPQLPEFLALDPATGWITQSQAGAIGMSGAAYTITAKNDLGSTSSPFTIEIGK